MSPRRLGALVTGLRSYEDTATYLQDRPDWRRQDEWMARLLEAVEHWGAVQVVAMGAKGSQLPSPARLFEHPDRPPADGKPAKKKAKKKSGGGKRLATPADIAKTLKGED